MTNESLRLAAWLQAHAKHLPVPMDENKMGRAAVVLRDLYKQNQILRELLNMDRREPHDAK